MKVVGYVVEDEKIKVPFTYIFMLLVTIGLVIRFEPLQNIIPNHPVLSFFTAAAAMMIITFLVRHIWLVGKAFSMFISMFTMYFLFWLEESRFETDSVQMYIFKMVIFTLIAIGVCLLTYRNCEGNFAPEIMRIPFAVIAGLINAVTVILYVIAVRGAWEDYRYKTDSGHIILDNIFANFTGCKNFASNAGAAIFYIVLTVICLGVVAGTVLLRDEID